MVYLKRLEHLKDRQLFTFYRFDPKRQPLIKHYYVLIATIPTLLYDHSRKLLSLKLIQDKAETPWV